MSLETFRLTVFRFQDEDDYEDEIFQHAIFLGARQPASFRRENARDVVFLLRALARMSSWRKQAIEVGSFIILRSGEGLTPYNKNNRANFSGEKTEIKLSGVSIFLEYAKKLKTKCRPRSYPRPRILRSLLISYDDDWEMCSL